MSSASLAAAVLVAVLLLSAPDRGLAQTPYSLGVITSSPSYTGPQFVSISGTVSPLPSPAPASVAISVVAPDGNQVESLVATTTNGNFSVSFVAGGGPDWTNGSYLVTATYSGSSASTTFSWTTAPQSTFSIFWITDTQFLSETNEGLFANTTGWIASHWSQYNGRMVVLTGDIAQDADVQGEYDNASDAMSVLLDAGIPYTWDAGNHDDLTTNPPTWLGGSEPAFNATEVGRTVDSTGYSHWVSSFDGGMDTAVNFTADHLGFLIVNLEFNADPQALSWAGSLLANSTYAHDYVIVATHAYINATGSLDAPYWGPILHNFTTGLTSLMDGYYPRVILTMNGHYNNGSGYHTPFPVDGRYELMFNRQDCTDVVSCVGTNSTASNNERVGASTVTILTFDALSDDLSVRSFDVFEGQYLNDSDDQYTLPGVLPVLPEVVTTTTTATLTQTSLLTTTAPARTVMVTTTLAPQGLGSLSPAAYAAMVVILAVGFALGYLARRH